MFRTISSILLLMLLFACEQTDNDGYLAAQVNEEKLYMEDLKVNFTEQQWNELSLQQKEEIVQDWIRLTLLAQEAQRTGISDTPAIQNKIEIARKNILGNAVIAQRLSQIKISEEDLFNYYRMHKNQYQKSHNEYALQRIFIQDETLLDSVRTAISESSFKAAAIIYSQEEAGKNGGFIGFVSQTDIPAKLWNVLKNLKKYHYQSVQMDSGIYIIRYYDERTVKTEKTFIEVKDEIRTRLIEEKKQEAYENLIEELKIKSEITISLIN